MCGIIGYIGKRDAYSILIKGLERLEYRGYDSAGIALVRDNALTVVKKKGKVGDLHKAAKEENVSGTLGIGHTRWATHGEPSDLNAHPHTSGDGTIALIHNGIIENYTTLRTALKKAGHTFLSETDTEVLAHLIEEVRDKSKLPFPEAVRVALTQVVGAYAIVAVDTNDPDHVVASAKGSPLSIGVTPDKSEFFFASSPVAFIDETKDVITLNDSELAVVSRDGTLELKTVDDEARIPLIEHLDLEIDALEKGGFSTYMEKEIFEQPEAIINAMRGHVTPDGSINIQGFEDHLHEWKRVERIIITACGTSWIAGLVGKYLLEELAQIPVEVEYASEFRYRHPVLHPRRDIVIAISQSGETADTKAALELAKEHKIFTYGIVNVVGSTIARMTDAGSFIHVGPEIGVASTKAFTGQVVILTLLALRLAMERKAIDPGKAAAIAGELSQVPDRIRELLKGAPRIQKIVSELFATADNALFLGRGYNFPVALEGALKLKEISYIHAEGYPAAEMKHGPIALIDENMPVVVVATNRDLHGKVVSNIQEIKARKGKVFAIVSEGDEEIKSMADYVIEVPETLDPLTPLLSVVPLQLLAYHAAVLRGKNVDQPRNLAKSVTVE